MDLALISEVIALLKESFDQLKDNELTSGEKDKILAFLKFLQERVFADIPDGMELYTELEKNIDNEEVIVKLKSAIEKLSIKTFKKKLKIIS